MPYKDREFRLKFNRENNKRLYRERREAWFKENGPCTDCGTWDNLQICFRRKSAIKRNHRVFMWREERRNAVLALCVARCTECELKRQIVRRGAKPLPRKNGHGIWAYKNGCRCDFCKSVKRISAKRERTRIKERKGKAML